ncbi:MAG: hypothetical protein ACRYGF_18020 [Janthinobacterium lividum]
MFPRRLNRAKFVVVLLCGTVCAAQAPSPGLRYGGTVGQQKVTLLLEVAGEAVGGGYYTYDRQKGDIRIVDVRQFGTTVVLQDEDGNILHLHFEDAAGEKTGSLQAADLLEGTLDRGELDLPVKLLRLKQSEK